MKHQGSPRVWRCYGALPKAVHEEGDRAHALVKEDPGHPSLHLKRIGRFWSVRVGLRHRALAIDAGDDTLFWVWIGTHAEYDQLLQRS